MDANLMATKPHPSPGTSPGHIPLFLPAQPPITGDPSGRLPLHEASRLRAAAHHAKRSYPGAIGELLERELIAHAEFGYRFTADGLLTRLAAEVLRVPVSALSHEASQLAQSSRPGRTPPEPVA